jgi:transposase-like protein
MAKKPESKSAKVRKMLEAGADTQAIVKKLGVKPQMVYTTRYQMNKKKGIGSIPKKAELPKVVNPMAAEKADTSSESVAVSGVEAGGFVHVDKPVLSDDAQRKIDGVGVFIVLGIALAAAVLFWSM